MKTVCSKCGLEKTGAWNKCKNKKPLTRDHLVPISRGGSDYILNIQALCRNCNSQKQAKLLDGVQFSLFDKVAC